MNELNGSEFTVQPNRAAGGENLIPDPQAQQDKALPPGMVEKVRAQAASLRNASVFTQAVGVMMRSPHYRNYTIGDLEWLLIPAITNRQYRLAEAKFGEGNDARTLPAAMVLWAFVSPEVDKRLTESTDATPKLDPSEWTSGEIPWLVHAAGDARIVRPLVKHLMQTTFRDRKVKVLGRDESNNVKIHVLETADDAPATA
jgi:hemolysin-activating ACP:hemolysin acyltransferase